MTANHFFFPSPFEYFLFTIYYELKKKKTIARSEEWRCMHLKMVNVKQITKPIPKKKKKPKKDVPDSKQAFMWVVDTHNKEEVSRTVKKFTTIFSNIFTTNIKGYCRVTNCSPHLNRNRKWAQQAQYNKFVREWVKELG